MTIDNTIQKEQVTTFTVKKKNKTHPNEVKYPGRPCSEVQDALYNLMGKLETNEEMEALIKGEIIIDEEKTAAYFDSLRVGDIFSCAVLKEAYLEPELQERVLSMYQIDSIETETDTLVCTDKSAWGIDKGTEIRVAFEDVSFSLASELTEILYRDGKPYGIPEETEVKVTVRKPPTTSASPGITAEDLLQG